ncbi:MAG TPA: 2-isopropylmalate synthase [Eubacteriales bacterium]|jgi:2-isopropylmalate synthase|nr:2-isopropylmalate synthase [Eubacteriales bacterium]
MRKIKIFDTTLRDGEQAPGCSMHLKEKLEVAAQLERLGVDIIEAGFAVSSPGDFESVKSVAALLKNCTVASLARSVKKDIDAAYEAVKDAVSPRIHIFLATSPIHMRYKLKMSEEDVIERIYEMTRYARSLIPEIEFSAEDAMRSEPEFLRRAVETAIRAGASVVNIPDTVGYATPKEMAERIKYLKENVENIDKAVISVHCHNDLGLAVANSLAAVEAGADQVECTVNGLGERAGNAALEEVVMAIKTRKNIYGGDTGINTAEIYRTSKLVYKTIGLYAPINKAIVGGNAFAHEAGIHQHGVLQNRETYEIMTPQSIGLPSNRMVFGKHSGKHAIEERLLELGHKLTPEEMEVVFESFKKLADKKRVINDADLEALIGHSAVVQEKEYQLDRFTVNSGNYVTSTAVVRLNRGGELVEKVAIGDGPVDAAFRAVDKIVKAPEHSLDDYSIRSVTEGNDALGEVIVRIRCGDRAYTGKGLSTDIIEASILAYINGINKLLDL